MNSHSSDIGRRIKEARKAAKLSQTELANILEKTLRTIQKYESGEIEPSIATINTIARKLNVSPAELIGYKKQELRLDTLSDVFFILNELNKKAGIRFDIDVKRPPHHDEWTCAIRFDGKDQNASHNADLCLFLERYADERERLETYWIGQESFDRWFEQELAYYANARLQDKEIEELSDTERIRRRNDLEQKRMEESNKATEDSGEK